jgi:uncharacterized protein (TIGR00661 family)
MAKLSRQPHRTNQLTAYNRQAATDFAAIISRPPRVIFTASAGGHLVELSQLNQLKNQYDSLLVIEKDDFNKNLDGPTEYLIRDINHNIFQKILINFKNLSSVIKIVKTFRPKFVVSTGASSATLTAWAAKLFVGAKVIFVETAASINRLSLAGKLNYPIADRFIVQHRQLQKVYQKVIYGGSIFSFQPPTQAAPSKHILVLLGTQKNSFRRLIEAVDKLDLPESIIVQSGHTKFSSDKLDIQPFVDPAEYDRLNQEAKLVISHAGVGSIMQALALGKPVVVMPRRRRFGEHLNDHQLQIAHSLAEQGLVTVVEKADQLESAVAQALNRQSVKTNFSNQSLCKLITDFIDGN